MSQNTSISGHESGGCRGILVYLLTQNLCSLCRTGTNGISSLALEGRYLPQFLPVAERATPRKTVKEGEGLFANGVGCTPFVCGSQRDRAWGSRSYHICSQEAESHKHLCSAPFLPFLWSKPREWLHPQWAGLPISGNLTKMPSHMPHVCPNVYLSRDPRSHQVGN